MASSNVEIIATIAVTPRGGVVHRVKHASTSTGTDMVFAIFLPSIYGVLSAGAAGKESSPSSSPLPAVYYLSGLTCTDQNVTQKAGWSAFSKADELGVAMVMPDTSPRGDGVPDDDAYDLGQGAGFYVDATSEPWNVNYKMESYVSKELPALVEEEWGVGKGGMKSIFGHRCGARRSIFEAMGKEEQCDAQWKCPYLIFNSL